MGIKEWNRKRKAKKAAEAAEKAEKQEAQQAALEAKASGVKLPENMDMLTKQAIKNINKCIINGEMLPSQNQVKFIYGNKGGLRMLAEVGPKGDFKKLAEGIKKEYQAAKVESVIKFLLANKELFDDLTTIDSAEYKALMEEIKKFSNDIFKKDEYNEILGITKEVSEFKDHYRDVVDKNANEGAALWSAASAIGIAGTACAATGVGATVSLVLYGVAGLLAVINVIRLIGRNIQLGSINGKIAKLEEKKGEECRKLLEKLKKDINHIMRLVNKINLLGKFEKQGGKFNLFAARLGKYGRFLTQCEKLCLKYFKACGEDALTDIKKALKSKDANLRSYANYQAHTLIFTSLAMLPTTKREVALKWYNRCKPSLTRIAGMTDKDLNVADSAKIAGYKEYKAKALAEKGKEEEQS